MKKSVLILAFWLLMLPQMQSQESRVVWITIDGLRWQEVYGGADTLLIKNQDFVQDVPTTCERFLRGSAEEGRRVLMPFLWSRDGVKAGNRWLGSKMNVTNAFNLSYPGYSEAMCGYADNERITSNKPIYNPNENVLEVVARDKRYQGKVLAFAGWDCFPYIINEQRNKLEVNAGYRTSMSPKPTEAEKVADKLLKEMIPQFEGERDDAFTFLYALEAMKTRHPDLLYLALCDADEYAHSGLYDGYLRSISRVDRLIKELWEYTQSDSYYRGKTTFIITCDHGRGDNPCNPREWRSHGAKYRHSDETWVMAFGAQVTNKGELATGQYYTCQVAPTIAKLLKVSFAPEGRALKPAFDFIDYP